MSGRIQTLGRLQGAINAVALRRRKVQKRSATAPPKVRVAVLGGRSSAAEPTVPA